jgi:pseudaminic acid synthase
MNSKKPYFIAEISANHNGSLTNAKKLISDAKKYGADYVKLQTYTPHTMTLKSKKNDFIIKQGLWKNQSLWDLYQGAQTPFEWQEKLFKYSKKINIKCFSTPFDETAVDLLEKLNCPMYKISSFEMNHIPLIEKVAKTKKPIIISTGMANINEIDLAYKTALKFGAKKISLLYCVSNYPAVNKDFNLNRISFLKKRYGCRVGFSDHSINNSIAKAAVIAGAELFEKHIALKNVKGPDYDFSLKGREIKQYANDLKSTFSLLGEEKFNRNSSENFFRKYRRSVYSTKKIIKGEKFNINNISVVRPGFGLSPKYFKKLLNKKSPINLNKFEKLPSKLITKLKLI